MPKASAPNAPWVDVWLSPQTTVMPGLGQPELRTDDVHDALVGVAQRVEPDAELGAVDAQRLDLGAGDRVGDRQVDVDRGHVVVLGRDRQVGAADRTTCRAKAVEGLRAGDLVDEVEIDVEQVRLALGVPDDVCVPDLLGQCAPHLTLRVPLRTCLSHVETAVSVHGQL